MGLSLVSLLTVCLTIAYAGSTPLESVSLHDEGRVDNINVTSKTLEDRSVGKKHYTFTLLFMNHYFFLLLKVEGVLLLWFNTPFHFFTGCFTWNGKSWLGVTPANPVPTACGLRTCIRCVEGKLVIPYSLMTAIPSCLKQYFT